MSAIYAGEPVPMPRDPRNRVAHTIVATLQRLRPGAKMPKGELRRICRAQLADLRTVEFRFAWVEGFDRAGDVGWIYREKTEAGPIVRLLHDGRRARVWTGEGAPE